MRQRVRLDWETSSEVTEYEDAVGHRMRADLRKLKDPREIQYWLDTKTRLEGRPDAAVVRAIGKTGRIRRPVVIDTDVDLVVEGRHRLAAGLEYGLVVPVVFLSRMG